jgi:hypothetical protein
MKKRCLGLVLLAFIFCAAAEINARAQEQCWTISTNDCESIGSVCTATYQSQQYSGSITGTGGLPSCSYGSPGNTGCSPDRTKPKQDCSYTCTITLANGTKVPVPQHQQQDNPPKLSGNQC